MFINKLKIYRKIKKIYETISIENIIKNFQEKNIFKIKSTFHILCIMFYHDKNTNYSLENLKLGYIIKRYGYFKNDIVSDSLNIYKKIIDGLKIQNNINTDDNIYEYLLGMIKNKSLNEYVNNKMLEIPNIRKRFEQELDNINIEDYQDMFGLLYETILLNKIDLNNINTDYIDKLLESEISNIRSNKLVDININFKLESNNNLSNELEDNDFDQNNALNEIIGWLGLGKKNKKKYQIINNEDINDDNDNNNINSDNLEDSQIVNNFGIIIEKNKEDDLDDPDYQDENQLEPSENSEDLSDFIIDTDKQNNIDNGINSILYKLKYKRYKTEYTKLKLVERVIYDNKFDSEILRDYDNLSDELVDMIIKKYYGESYNIFNESELE